MKFKNLIFTILLILILGILNFNVDIISTAEKQVDKFRIWIVTDTHMGTNSYGYSDKYVFEDAIQDSENDWDFNWDIAFVLGDLTDTGTVKQYEELVDTFNVLTNHNREDFYLISGNHDINGGISRYNYYIDQLGKNSQYSGMDNNKRKYYLENISGDLDGYTIRVGNTLFIMMAPSWGNKNYYDYEWWENIVNNIPKHMNVICMSHHYVEGSGIFTRYVGGIENSKQFADWMMKHPGLIDAWFCGHIHWEYNETGTTFVSTRWGTFFLCAASIDDGHTNQTGSKSIVLTFNKGSNIVQVDDYYHGFSTNNYLDNIEQWDNNDPKRGYQSFKLNYPFSFTPISTTPPLDTIILFDGIHSLNDTFHELTSDTKILFTVEDVENRLGETRYKIDYGSWMKYTIPFNISEMGFHVISFYSFTKDGLSEVIHKEFVKIVKIKEADDLSPYTAYKIEPYIMDPEFQWNRNNVTITFNAFDAGSGVNRTYYTLDTIQLNWEEYADPITITDDGIHEILYYSIDNAGNVEDIKIVVIKIDKTNPEIFINKLPSIFFGNPFIRISGHDISSGVESIELYIDSKLVCTVNNSVLEYNLELYGEHDINIIACDISGNINGTEQKILVINGNIIFIIVIFIIVLSLIFFITIFPYIKKKKK